MQFIFGIPLTIPNVLSLYRIVAFPAILVCILLNKENLFAWLLCINLVTDILDGMFARLLKQETEIGARLDSMADNGTYVLAFWGLYQFKSAILNEYFIPFSAMLLLFIASILLALFKFKKFPSLHLYSWKVGGYLQGIFFFTIFAFDFYAWFFWLMATWTILAFSEHIIIQILINDMKSNARGLYWVLRDIKNHRANL
jgi:cardiolipin synthase (CMP-forming)